MYTALGWLWVALAAGEAGEAEARRFSRKPELQLLVANPEELRRFTETNNKALTLVHKGTTTYPNHNANTNDNCRTVFGLNPKLLLIVIMLIVCVCSVWVPCVALPSGGGSSVGPSPLCGSPVGVPCVGPLCVGPLCGSPVWVPRRAESMWHLLA